jgi:hypothetical protein
MQRCTICNGHHDLESSDLCPVCEGSQVGSRTNLPDKAKPLGVNLALITHMAAAVVRADGDPSLDHYVTASRLRAASDELLRRAVEWDGCDYESYIKASALCLWLSKECRPCSPDIIP